MMELILEGNDQCEIDEILWEFDLGDSFCLHFFLDTLSKEVITLLVSYRFQKVMFGQTGVPLVGGVFIIVP
jgi:hypothetical protein